ncbi:Protein arginine N-methyltransferase 5 [Orchesella cincta]|uniref:Protein arginine N-methyltransferase n=1 Tax=Orchesella cincta TaxID=48709 RepID=A0A1D2NG04_ORCCI|nr:Protein arginine N-methyltransferase 5 [Orchesella cincta]
MPKKVSVGIYLDEVPDNNIQHALTDARESGFNTICTELLTKKYCLNELNGDPQNMEEPFGWFDMALPSADWNSSVVGVLSDIQEQTESHISNVRCRAAQLLEKQIGYAHHLGLPATILKLHPGESCNLSRLIYSKVTTDGGYHNNVVVWMRMPMVFSQQAVNGAVDESGQGSDEKEPISSWNTWNKFRTVGCAERRTFPVLDLPVDLPDQEEIDRWLGEPVKAIFLCEEAFVSNNKGFPILPKRTQQVLRSFFDINVQIIMICKPQKSPNDYLHFKQYIEYLHGAYNTDWEEDPVRKYTKGYEDYLQSPLQPLMDNLEANTYEVFERDPTKYILYQKAMAKALVFKIPEDEKDTKSLVVMVVGAGRGPLVRNCLAAAASVQRKIKLYAVEKNCNAVCTLLHLKKHVWGDSVTVISKDMREWNPEEKADIIVSELLGSFGDNELSPECLDGAQKFLKEDGIMIPENYTSFISPIMSPRIHQDVRPFQDINKHTNCNYETPYVVYMKNFYEIAKPKPLFVFCHPKSDVKETNDRYEAVEFDATQDCMMSGFAGYFESVLFDDIMMSIHPRSHSTGMFSWFPIYFPIREPIQIKKGQKVKVHFWRCSSKHNVWYEWSVSEPVPVPIHNVNGRSYTIGL